MQIFQGNILTCDGNDTVVQFLVEKDGKIKYVGNNLPRQYEGQPCRNLEGGALLPAFSDTHIHLSSHALLAHSLDLREAGSLEEIGDLIGKYLCQNPGKFILGFGASPHTITEQRLITRRDLDSFSRKRAIMIVKYDGHACIINSAMIYMLPNAIQQLPGFDREKGLLTREAFLQATSHITRQVSLKELGPQVLETVNEMADKGLGLVHTAEGVGFPLDMDVRIIRLLSRGLISGFQIRIFFQTMNLAKIQKLGLQRVGGCFATALDGCLGSVDAALQKPYSHDSSWRGILFYTDREVKEFVKNANRAGLHVQLHAIGDQAFDQAISAFAQAQEDCPWEEHRHSIIHACLPTPWGLEKAAELGLTFVVQPAFLHWPLEPQEYLEKILGDRIHNYLPLQTMIKQGIHVTGSSDAPCTFPDPLQGIAAACNHFIPGESLSVAQALRLFTCNGPWLSCDETERGSLEKGKNADLIILNKNPLGLPPTSLHSLQVEETILEGQVFTPEKSSWPRLLIRSLFNRNARF